MKIISTDPPYYDNIGYADLSDFFYVWLRTVPCEPIFPYAFRHLDVPKAEELVATPDRHGGQEKAEAFFLEGMTPPCTVSRTRRTLRRPLTIYYAFKQAETDDGKGTASTGWETFLDAVIRAGFSIAGTWPMRSEQEHRSRGMGTNALASSIFSFAEGVPAQASYGLPPPFLRELNQVLPEALDEMTRGSGEDCLRLRR